MIGESMGGTTAARIAEALGLDFSGQTSAKQHTNEA
jgi:hypothetical protein